MTKTLTEQWRDNDLADDKLYYWRISDGQELVQNKLGMCAYRLCNDSDKIECLAPVPSYGSLYNPNDGRVPVGLFTVLKLIKRDIEQYQKIRHLTDLECGIKSQVVSLLKRWGVK